MGVMTDVEMAVYNNRKWFNDGITTMFSALDTNKKFIREYAERTTNPIIVGGYVNPDYFSGLPHVTWANDVDDLLTLMPGAKKRKPNYSLFAGTKTVPRITLSEGCLHSCAFCTIPKGITKRSVGDILGQVDSIRELYFELIYLDDKTFGQADNWDIVSALYDYIKDFNPKFQGFIVQTTVPVAIKYLKDWVANYHIKYVEVGVETVNDKILKEQNKPYRSRNLKALTSLVRETEVGFIPNIMVGLPGDDYTETASWLTYNRDIITFVNPYVLSLYDDAKGTAAEGNTNSDSDESNLNKSWLSVQRQNLAQEMLDFLLSF